MNLIDTCVRNVFGSVCCSKFPQTQIEWAQLLESQQRYHENEMEKWREIIKSSVLLLDEVRSSTSLKNVELL